MKKNLLTIASLLLLGWQSNAQDLKTPYQFSTVIDNEKTEVKCQDNTGTCWSFSTTSFVESELIRLGKGDLDVSEMYFVRRTYPVKADLFVRYNGKHQFSEGGLAHDVVNAIGQYGIVPQSIYSGYLEGQDKYNHRELVKFLRLILDETVKAPVKSATWKLAVESLLDAYIGKIPASFEVGGKQYTPQSYSEYLGFEADKYVSITSFAHQPFYKDFILETSDNFSNGAFKNVPLNDFVDIVDNALENGFTLALDADVSEGGFSSKYGMAIYSEKEVKEDDAKAVKELFEAKEIAKEGEIDQSIRQQLWDNFKTTDDHLMHITGIVKDQNGTKYYMVKNSWGTDKRGHDGYIYMSESYLKAKAVSVLLHEDGLTKKNRKELNL